jgi:uncharacterized membrane protein YhhN
VAGNEIYLLAPLALAVLDWVAVAYNGRRLEYFAKPAVMVALLVWFALVSGLTWPRWLFVLALLLSLAGDVFFMLPSGLYLAGLASFLLAHLAYVTGFSIQPPPGGLTPLGLAVLLAAMAVLLLRRITEGVQRQAKGERLRIPVLIYGAVITLMLFSALLTLLRPDWPLAAARLVSAGAALFFISDSLHAWDRFVEKIRNGRLILMIAYHLGQIALIAGIALRYPHP